MLWDIMQVYTQSKTELNHIVICHLPAKLRKRYSEGTILHVVKLLYSLIKAGNYWFAIYLDHHKKNLGIEILFYDACLLIIKASGENFSIAELQTNNIFNNKIEVFMNKEEAETTEAKFKAKSQIILETGTSEDFNSCYIIIKAESIMII